MSPLDSVVSRIVGPKSAAATPKERIAQLKDHLSSLRALAVLTGAGVSTASGLPDYRSPAVGRIVNSSLVPVQYSDFLKDAQVRKMQWARSFAAWPEFSRFQPNQGHWILKEWELQERLHWLITQNVDWLHSKAGAVRQTELHGTAYRVRCVSCSRDWHRAEFQFYLERLNRYWYSEALRCAPDGDVDIAPDSHHRFTEPLCDRCGSIVKPDMVFFGECVPQERFDFIEQRLRECDGLLVLGTSVQVLSSYRLVQLMSARRKPIYIVNIGDTRADHLCNLKVEYDINSVLSALD